MEPIPDLPKKTKITTWREYLQLMLDRFATTADSKDYYHPNNIIKLVGYALVRDYIRNDKADTLVMNAVKLGVLPQAGRPVDLFNLGLKALMADSPYPLSEANRSKYAVQLRYAYDHDVLPRWLPPFLLQAGGYEAISTKVKLKKREAWRPDKPKIPHPDDLIFTPPDKITRSRETSSETEPE